MRGWEKGWNMNKLSSTVLDLRVKIKPVHDQNSFSKSEYLSVICFFVFFGPNLVPTWPRTPWNISSFARFHCQSFSNQGVLLAGGLVPHLTTDVTLIHANGVLAKTPNDHKFLFFKYTNEYFAVFFLLLLLLLHHPTVPAITDSIWWYRKWCEGAYK